MPERSCDLGLTFSSTTTAPSWCRAPSYIWRMPANPTFSRQPCPPQVRGAGTPCALLVLPVTPPRDPLGSGMQRHGMGLQWGVPPG